MDCCCGESDEGRGQQQGLGLAEQGQRKCRDVVFLILFCLFWVGMFVVCGIAVEEGDSDRLIYGLDSYGFLCGTKNKIAGQEVDLTKRTNLYFLNPLELVDPSNYLYAKSVCVAKCPAPADRCDPMSIPCRKDNQYRCPYYLVAPYQIYGTLNRSNVQPFSTQYFGALSSSTVTNCTKELPAGVNTKLAEGVNITNITCGSYYRLRSQYGRGPCYPVWTSTVEFLNRCFPDASLDSMLDAAVVVGGKVAADAKEGKDFQRQFGSLRKRATQYIADLQRGYEVLLLAGALGGLVLALLWIVVLRYCVGLMAWVTIIALNVLIFGLMLFAYDKAGYLTKAGAVGDFLSGAMPEGLDPAKQYQRVWLILAIVMTVLFVLTFLLTIIMIRRIRIAVATIKEASKSVAVMPAILLYPILPFIFNVGLLMYWVFIFGLLYSAGAKVPHYRTSSPSSALSIGSLYNVVSNTTLKLPPAAPLPARAPMSAQEAANRCPTDPNCYFTYEWNQKLRYAFLYHLFGLLWTYQFFMGATYITLGGAFGAYYWAGGVRSQMPPNPITMALKNTAAYHLGSAALGGAIVAILQFVRIILQYVFNKTRQAGGGALLQWFCCCAQCCLYCIQKIVEFINKQAYVLIGVKGYGYCQAASAAVALILTNAARLTAVNVLADVMLLLGKLAVSAGCALLAFVACDQPRYNDRVKNPKTYISTPLLVVVFCALIGYIIADVFLSVYEVGIETIILCFCEDCNSHDGNPKYAPDSLLEAIGQSPNNKGASSPGQRTGWKAPTPEGYYSKPTADSRAYVDDRQETDYRQQPQAAYDARQAPDYEDSREYQPRGMPQQAADPPLPSNGMFQFQAQRGFGPARGRR